MTGQRDADAEAPAPAGSPFGPGRNWRLRLVHVRNLRLAVDPSLRQAYRARFEGTPPRVRAHSGEVSIEYGPRFRPADWRRQGAEVALSPSVGWRIEAAKRLERLRADLAGIRLLGVEVEQQTVDARLTLPRPAGTVTLRFAGGVADLVIRRPTGAAAALHVNGGAARVTFDEQFYKAVGGEGSWRSSDYERAADRYEIFLSSGARDVVVESADIDAERPARRLLATVLFTDIVASTHLAEQVGDRRWRELLDLHDDTAKRLAEREGGRLVKSTGDGILALFDAPGNGIRCARDLQRELRGSGMELRAGLHTGEVELRDDDVGGIAVHIAARVMAAAGPGEVLVSRTVRDLTAGSGVELEDRGPHTLKGVGDQWQLFAAT